MVCTYREGGGGGQTASEFRSAQTEGKANGKATEHTSRHTPCHTEGGNARVNTDSDARDWCLDEQQSNRLRDTRRDTPSAAMRESTDGDAHA